MRKIAIISVNGVANIGGVERVVYQHRQVLDKIARVRVFSLPHRGWFGTLRRSHNVNALCLAIFPLISSFFARCWAGRKGTVISHGYSSVGLLCDLVFAHGCWAGYIKCTRLRMGVFGRIIFLYEWLAAHLARKVVGVSESVIRQWETYYGLNPKRSEVLLNSVDTSIFQSGYDQKSVCASDELRVIFVGRFEAGKGADYLIRLHEEIASEQSPVYVRICSPTKVTEETIRKFHLFQFQCGLDPGRLAAEYNKADLFLLPSRYEAFELSSLEALACGTPVLLNDTGSRPTLERLGCPGLFPLEEAVSPLDAIRRAGEKFRGRPRSAIADWTQLHFSGRDLAVRLTSLCEL